MIVFHCTTQARARSIIKDGFRGLVGVSNRPAVDHGLVRRGEVVLEMEIPENVFDVYTYFPRWMIVMARIPSSVLNRYGKPTIGDYTVPWVVQQLRKLGYTDDQIRMVGCL